MLWAQRICSVELATQCASKMAGVALALHRRASALNQSAHAESRLTQTTIVCHAESMLQWQGWHPCWAWNFAADLRHDCICETMFCDVAQSFCCLWCRHKITEYSTTPLCVCLSCPSRMCPRPWLSSLWIPPSERARPTTLTYCASSTMMRRWMSSWRSPRSSLRPRTKR